MVHDIVHLACQNQMNLNFSCTENYKQYLLLLRQIMECFGFIIYCTCTDPMNQQSKMEPVVVSWNALSQPRYEMSIAGSANR